MPRIADISIEDAAAALAARAFMTKSARTVIEETGERRPVSTKQAFTLATAIDGLKNTGAFKAVGDAVADPDSMAGGGLKGSLIGAGVGGLAGLGLGAVRNKDDEDAPSPLSSALSGALAGGGIGAGLGMIGPASRWMQGTDSQSQQDRFNMASQAAKNSPAAATPPGILDSLTESAFNHPGAAALSAVPAAVGVTGLANQIGTRLKQLSARVDNVADPRVLLRGMGDKSFDAVRSSLQNAPAEVQQAIMNQLRKPSGIRQSVGDAADAVGNRLKTLRPITDFVASHAKPDYYTASRNAIKSHVGLGTPDGQSLRQLAEDIDNGVGPLTRDTSRQTLTSGLEALAKARGADAVPQAYGWRRYLPFLEQEAIEAGDKPHAGTTLGGAALSLLPLAGAAVADHYGALPAAGSTTFYQGQPVSGFDPTYGGGFGPTH